MSVMVWVKIKIRKVTDVQLIFAYSGEKMNVMVYLKIKIRKITNVQLMFAYRDVSSPNIKLIFSNRAWKSNVDDNRNLIWQPIV